MVWIANHGTGTTFVKVTKTTHPEGSDQFFTQYPKQNETWDTCHWTREGDEKMTIKWEKTGVEKTFDVATNAHVFVFDDSVGISTALFTHVS